MTQQNEEELILKIKTNSPETSRNNLIRAFAASIRWSAHADKTEHDAENIVYLAQFIEEIVPDEN